MLQSQYDRKHFFKFPKIKNLGNSEIYDDAEKIPENGFPSLELQKKMGLSFYVSEKIDGCNIGLYIPKDGSNPYFFSRNGEDATGLFDFEKDKDQLKHFVECVQKFLAVATDIDAEGIYFWGEYFGNRVNRRINYGDKGRVRFYDAMFVTKENLDDPTRSPKLLTPLFFVILCVQINIFATQNGYADELKDSMMWEFLYPIDVDFESASKEELLEKFVPEKFESQFAIDHSFPEGFVITAADDDKIVGRWKIKAQKFLEREKQPKLPKEVDDELINARNVFAEYLNVNRAIAVLSKTTDRTMKTLLVEFVNDAKEDFLEEHPEVKVKDEKWLKAVFNAGKKPYLTMLEAIKQEVQE